MQGEKQEVEGRQTGKLLPIHPHSTLLSGLRVSTTEGCAAHITALTLNHEDQSCRPLVCLGLPALEAVAGVMSLRCQRSHMPHQLDLLFLQQ